MKKIFTLALLLLSAAWCFGQAPKYVLSTSSADVYVGYITTSPDYGEYWSSYLLSGGEIAYTRNIRKHWGIIASGAAVFGTRFEVNEFSGTVGAKYNILTGRIRPYATVQIGYAYQNSNGMYAGDHHPPLKPGITDVEDGFSTRSGVGADFQLTRRFYWRVIQWDVQPQPWARHTPFYDNVSSGIGFRL